MSASSARALSWWVWLFGMFLVWGASEASATPWRVMAPDPLASDSSYAALSARPADSLSAGELSWLLVQRDWRKQRSDEQRGGGSGITDASIAHRPRGTDRQFAQLASLPFHALSGSDLTWLVAESQAQRSSGPTTAETGSNVVGVVLVAAVVGVLAAYLTVGSIFNGIFH